MLLTLWRPICEKDFSPKFLAESWGVGLSAENVCFEDLLSLHASPGLCIDLNHGFCLNKLAWVSVKTF